jgi:hypothetical protein
MEDRRSSAAIATPTANDAPRDSAAFVSGNDTPLVGERSAARGRSATDGGDEHAGVKRPLTRWRGGFVARHGTSLIGERAATRGRGATEGRDEHASVKRGFSFVRPPTERLRRTTRPGTRTLVNDLPADVGGCAGWRHVGATPLDLELHALRAVSRAGTWTRRRLLDRPKRVCPSAS